MLAGPPGSTVHPSRPRCSANRAGVVGLPPSSSIARTIRPLVALLKCETTFRVPSTSCSTRTVTTRRAVSGSGRQNEAYVDERRSTTSPRPAASFTAPSSRLLQNVPTVPMPGRVTSPESR